MNGMHPDLNDLEQRLRDYYGRQRLSRIAVERLAASMRSQSRPRPVRASVRWKRVLLTGAACSALAALGVITLLALALTGPDRDAPAEMAAREVAANHHKRLALEFPATEVAELTAQMTKLDFSLVMPQRMRDGRHRLLGARYCSLGGEIAAQLRFEDSQGRLCTLYEVRAVQALASVRDGEFHVDGCHVVLWREEGLLMAMAGPSPERFSGSEIQ